MHIELGFKTNPVLFSGKVQCKEGLVSAIFKKEIKESIFLSELGLTGDECADKKNHGGIDRALHYYPKEHYDFWRAFYNDASIKWEASGMGENISAWGLTEDVVYIGDRFQLGEAIIEISQPRSPCATLNQKWGVENLSYFVQSMSKCGWLFRVLQTGHIPPHSVLTLLERPAHSLTVKEVCDIFFGNPLHTESLHKLLNLDALSSGWKETIKKRLDTHKLEDWSKRLYRFK